MIILRVVYNASAWSSNVPNNTAKKPRYLHMAADSTYTYSNKTGLQGDSGDPFPGTQNVTACVPFPKYPITDIREQGDSITFKLMGGVEEDSTTTAVVITPKGRYATEAVYSLTGQYMGERTAELPTGVYILRRENGETDKIIIR